MIDFQWRSLCCVQPHLLLSTRLSEKEDLAPFLRIRCEASLLRSLPVGIETQQSAKAEQGYRCSDFKEKGLDRRKERRHTRVPREPGRYISKTHNGRTNREMEPGAELEL